MKSPAQLTAKLKRQWHSSAKREYRLLSGSAAWPVTETIGKPSANLMATDLDAVIQHINTWKRVTTGQIIWEEVNYRATAEPVKIPTRWQLDKPSEWVQACNDKNIQAEFEAMATLADQTDSIFHSALIRRRSLWQDKPLPEVIQACNVARALTPGYARGKPLRSLSLENIDTKFFERHARLITKLLDTRFENEVSALGLEVFLDALSEGEHWLLLVDLDGNLLPFKKQRVSTAELATTTLPGQHLLIVENESSLHQLPDLADTIAILGAGFDLDWTGNPKLAEKHIGYWGDIDSWGLHCLAKARANLPHLHALLMSQQDFNQHKTSAVNEPVTAGTEVPASLHPEEKELYQYLLGCELGRLEQEFLPFELVQNGIRQWARS